MAKKRQKGAITRRNNVEVKNPTSSKTWKQFELIVSRDFGTERMPGSGGITTLRTRSDSQHDDLFIECKYRGKFSIYDLFLETAEKAMIEEKTPMVALKQKGARGYLLLIRAEDLPQIAQHYVGINSKK